MSKKNSEQKFSYAQGWNACLDGKRFDSKAYPQWIEGFNDCLEHDPDDRMRLKE